MRLYEGLEDFAYYVNVNDVPKVPDVGELMDILFDDYALDSEYYDKDICIVYAPSENTVKKLERCLMFYGTPTNIIKDIINKNNIHESKKYFNNKHMKRNFNLSRLTNRRMNESLKEESTFNRYDRILETYRVNMFGDFDPIFEAEEKDKKDECKCRYNGKLISKMHKAEKMDAKKEVRNQIKDLKTEIKTLVKAGKSTKMLEKKLERLEHVLECLMGRCEKVNESVSSSFMRRRRLFENDDVFADEEPENSEEDKAAEDETENDNEPEQSPEETSDDKEEYEDVEMKAVVLTVLKKNVETVKSAMIEAGVSEDDVNVDEMDDDASDDDKVDIRVDVNSIDALKTYLESVGINLEEELDGEIISNNDEEPVNDEEPTDTNDDEPSDDEFDDLFKDE